MIGIIGAMEDEVALLKEQIHESQTERLGGFDMFTGILEEKQVCLVQCGIGKVNAAIGCTMLIRAHNPDLIINTGSAGGVIPGLEIGDTVIANGLTYHDVDLTAFSYAIGQLPGMPQVFPVLEPFISQAERAIDELITEKILPKIYHYRRGLIGSGDMFMHDPHQVKALCIQFPNLCAVDMESGAIAQTCFRFNVPVLVIRSISDHAGYESPMNFDEFLAVASNNSAEIVRRIVKNAPDSFKP
ncbi:5'-methylthioadenosine/S-adenosylhomocysteine nucleosidase [Spirochaetia bacterium]|nr:5'-methylthioadenosine/S-adenosylhomocysteine nucleosidase [Spirochaetia bacterium]